MDYFTLRELREKSGAIWQHIEAGEEFAIRRNAKPFALLVRTEPAAVETRLQLDPVPVGKVPDMPAARPRQLINHRLRAGCAVPGCEGQCQALSCCAEDARHDTEAMAWGQ